MSGTETLTLPNESETIRTISTKSGIVSMLDGTFAGKEILTTEEDGSESATATVYEIVSFDMQNGEGRGIILAYIHTDSTARLAPLAGMILTGIDELHPDETSLFTLWEWQSRISLPFTTIDINAMAATEEEEQQTTIMPAPQLE